MKKVLFVDEHKVVNYAGGIEKVICAFANEFVEKDYELAIVWEKLLCDTVDNHLDSKKGS